MNDPNNRTPGQQREKPQHEQQQRQKKPELRPGHKPDPRKSEPDVTRDRGDDRA